MTEEYKGFKIGDKVKFTEDAVKPLSHEDKTVGTVVEINIGEDIGCRVKTDDGSMYWYGDYEIELLDTVTQQQPTVLDELTVRNISEALSGIYAIHGITDGEIVAAVTAYLRGLQDAMGIRNYD